MKVHHVKKAQKDRPEHGIKKGDSYYWWEFRYGGKRYSKEYPKREQLTQSDFLLGQYAAEDRIAELDLYGKGYADIADLGDRAQAIAADAREIAEEIRTLGEEQREKFDNMPEGLQQGDTGQLLEGRADECESWADALEQAADEVPEREDEATDEEYTAELESWIDELKGAEYGGE